jgi:3-hydroxy-3-methylglutaryl CoA synthase
MAEYGITGFGAYVPRLRLERAAIASAHAWMAPSSKSLAKGERSFCSWDEDSITMGVEAARDCLGDKSRQNIRTLIMASTTFPYADLQNSVIAAGALGLNAQTTTGDIGGSQRAGVAGLVQALRCGEGEQIFIAADRLYAKSAGTQEMNYGAGAASFRLGSEAVLAKFLGSGCVLAQFFDHFRSSDVAYDYFWEERWIRDEGYGKLIPQAVKAALADAELAMVDITTLVVASPLKGAVSNIGKLIGFSGKIADTLDAGVGYTGLAHPLLMLAGVLESAKPGERLLVIGFGQGAEALILEVTDAIADFAPARGLSMIMDDKIVTRDYLRMLSFYRGIELEWGMRGEATGKAALTTLYRESHQLSAFVAGKCTVCGFVQFPQLAYCVNPTCHASSSQFAALPLTDAPAKVLTYTSDWLSYYPAPPLYVGFVQFDNGARLLMETVDVGPEGIEEGTPLRVVFRIKEPDKVRNFNRYFWKTTPIAKGV